MKATDKTLNDSITALTGRVTTLESELEIAKNNIGIVSSAENCVITLAKGQKHFTEADDESFIISDTDVVAGWNTDFCGYTFKEIKFEEE